MTVHPYVLSQEQFIKGDQLTYPFQERGLQFGDGVYEVIRVYQGEYYLLKEHVERLFRSAKAIRLELPLSLTEVYEKLEQLLKTNEITGDAKVYLQVTRGSAVRDHHFPDCNANLYAYVQDMPRPLENIRQGVCAITRPDERWQNCYIKSLNLLPNVLAKQEANENGCFEAILHREGIVTECSTANVYIVKGGTIYTHPETNHILHGCVRSRLKQLAATIPVTIVEDAFTLDQLAQAEEVFLSSSVSEITPIVQVDGQQVQDGNPGKITRLLQKAYEKDAAIKQSTISSSDK